VGFHLSLFAGKLVSTKRYVERYDEAAKEEKIPRILVFSLFGESNRRLDAATGNSDRKGGVVNLGFWGLLNE
tara:strand:+ start:635 stop:850 length:216 start_codon:yes stop_codon:yes gene_type:complete